MILGSSQIEAAVVGLGKELELNLNSIPCILELHNVVIPPQMDAVFQKKAVHFEVNELGLFHPT